MDLDNFSIPEDDSGVDMELENPKTGEPLLHDDGSKLTVRLVGQDSPEFIAIKHKLANRRMKKMRPGKTAFTAEEVEADSLEILVAITKGWVGIVWKGQELPFSAANVRMLYTAAPWLREQVDRFTNDRANFLKNA